MSARNTPVAYMTGERFARWADRRTAELKRERRMRYLAAVVIPLFVVLVAVVIAGYAWSAL